MESVLKVGATKTYKTKNAFYVFFTLFLIYCSDSLLFRYNSNEIITSMGEYLTIAVAIVLFFYLIISNNFKNTYVLLFVILAIVSLCLTGLYYSEFSGGYISKISLFLLGFAACDLLDVKRILTIYIDIMMVICTFSLICTAFGFAIVGFPLPTITNIQGSTFKTVFFTNINTNDYIRNYGPFTEPARYQAYINFGLILLFFNKSKKKNLGKIVLFIITLISTFSTTGYIAFLFIFVAFIISKNSNIKLSYKVVCVLLGIIFTVLLLNLNSLFNDSLNKIFEGESSSSYSVRYNSIFGSLIVIKNNLIFGTGIQNYQQEFIWACRDLLNVGNEYTSTNTILLNFAKFGIIPGTLYLYGICKTSRVFDNNIIVTILIFCGLFCLTSGISFLDSIFFNFIAFIFISNYKKV